MASSNNGGDQPLVAPAGGANPPIEPLTEGRDAAAAAPPKETGQADQERVIREAAYSAYERRGKTEGDAVQDWLAAEAEVNARNSSKVAELARKLDATPEQVEEAIRAVGPNASDIELHLKGTRSTTNAERTDATGKE
ncbi:DUF2934 domain-containing protein [Variovorax sp. Varisp41]|jgi:hypothetical protein|uniref:DUF2934 domain-containing protein n=1 Tax=Variovorax sp. Varisp41 TaxID=3243033 RepID=UPI0039B4D340|eukprot:TRINITY_DN11886_c0_g1_i6.p2 TRINITY_DN11886_c0_g1~~TRINITY_DN11886_c0_g1_i6.p2  ORF type:complete len:138 (+),score=34.70 TRINITY_DN11886_c0_g1_i6:461-874(+)